MLRHKIWTATKWTTLLLFISGTGMGIYATNHIYQSWIKTAPKLTKADLDSDNSSKMLDRDGHVIWESNVDVRQKASYKDLPKPFIDALTSTENRDFFTDPGYSWKGLASAGKNYLLKDGSTSRGGSTITQQLVKLSEFSTKASDQTIKRKVQELYLASALTKTFSKQEILEFYVNKMYEGHGRYGVQTISDYYYGKKLRDLNVSQQAIIAGIGQSPDMYNLYTDAGKKATEKRRNEVLLSMYNNDKLTKSQYRKIKATPIDDGLISVQDQQKRATKMETIIFKNQAFVQSALSEIKESGYDPIKDGLVIQTGLDPKQQATIADEIDHNSALAKMPKLQMAATAVDPKTGQVRAQVGGRHLTWSDRYGLNRATQTSRSSGSGIKPLIDYLPAMENFNWGSAHRLSDTPYTYPGTNVKLGNSDNRFMGSVTMTKALAYSRNTTAVRTLDAVGSKRATTFLDKVGIKHPQTVGGQDAIGLDESTAHMAGAFATIANGGTYRGVRYVTSVQTPDGRVSNFKAPNSRAMTPASAYIMTDMLKHVLDKNATGQDANVSGIHQAVKSGTVAYGPSDPVPSMAVKDSWVNGYTKGLALSTWAGYDQPLAPGHYIDIKDATQDQKVYAAIMKRLAKDYDHSDWQRPNDVVNSADGLIRRDIKQTHNIATKSIYNDTDAILRGFTSQEHAPIKFKHEQQTLPRKDGDD